MEKQITIKTENFTFPAQGTAFPYIADAVNKMCGTDYKSIDMRHVSAVHISFEPDSASPENPKMLAVFLHADHEKYGNYSSKDVPINSCFPAGKFILEHFEHTDFGHQRLTFIKQDEGYTYIGVCQLVANFDIDGCSYGLWQRI